MAQFAQRPHFLIGHGSYGHVARDNQDGMQVKAALAPLPTQSIVPVELSKPGSPKARKSQGIMARCRRLSTILDAKILGSATQVMLDGMYCLFNALNIKAVFV